MTRTKSTILRKVASIWALLGIAVAVSFLLSPFAIHHLWNTDLLCEAGLVIAWCFPKLGDGLLAPVENLFSRLAARKRLAVLAIALFAILVRVSLLRIDPVPQIHSKFSYLLAAETFAHGCLTNPPHPMRVFFDAFHVNQQPTYMSKYPPAQGAVLALGERLGSPWIGVLLSTAAMCAAMRWMLQGRLPARGAPLGASLVFLRFELFSHWLDSYWGRGHSGCWRSASDGRSARGTQA